MKILYLPHREKREERKVAIIAVLADKSEGMEPNLGKFVQDIQNVRPQEYPGYGHKKIVYFGKYPSPWSLPPVRGCIAYSLLWMKTPRHAATVII